MIIIRKYKPNDKVSIIKLWQDTTPTQITQKQVDTPLNEELKEFELLFVAEKSGEIIGTCKAIYDDKQDRLFSIVISPQFNNKSINSKLLHHATSQLNKLT